jgi:hypothetical protein
LVAIDKGTFQGVEDVILLEEAAETYVRNQSADLSDILPAQQLVNHVCRIL